MKTRFLFSLAVMALVFAAHSQSLPKSGAILKLESKQLVVHQGESAETTVEIVRSSRFKKGKLDGLQVQQRDGVILSIEPVADQPDVYTLTAKHESLVAGRYALIIKATGKMAHQVRQTMFTLVVQEQPSIASSNN